MPEATAWRYADETLDVLAAWAPGPHEDLAGLGEGGFVITGGTLIPTGHIRADEPYYSMKHRRHGMNARGITTPDGTPPWYSRALSGCTHDLTAACAHHIIQACLMRQTPILTDRAYQDAGVTVRTPYKHHSIQLARYQQFNRGHTRLRAPGERTFTQLKTWRILRRARCSTNRVSRITQATHTLLTCDCSGRKWLIEALPFHLVLEGEMGWSDGVVTRQGPSSLAW